jgi:hypothetical protein
MCICISHYLGTSGGGTRASGHANLPMYIEISKYKRRRNTCINMSIKIYLRVHNIHMLRNL